MAATGASAKGLANIRHDKPEVPGEGEEPPPKVSSCDIRRVSTGSAKSAGAPPVVGVTATFQSLINGLVQQHLVELAAAQGATGEDSIGVAVPRQWSQGFRSATRKITEPKAQQAAEGKDMFGDRAHTADMERLTSVDSAVSSGSERRRATNGGYMRSPTIGDVLCKKKDNLAQMNASKILEALEEDDEDDGCKSPASFAGDMKALFRHRGSMEEIQWTKSGDVKRYLQMSKSERATYWLTSTPYEMVMAAVLLLNVLWMALDLQIHGSMSGSAMGIGGTFLFESGEYSDELIHAGDVFFAVIFAVDLVARIIFVGRRFWHSWPNYIDLAVSVTSIVELSLYYSLEFPLNPVIFRLLRIGKLARAIRMVTMTSVLGSLQLLVKCLSASRPMLFWSFCLLTFVQFVAGLVVSALCFDFIRDPQINEDVRRDVFLYYGTFSRTTLSMFEIMFANWSPPCRVLVESVSEYFTFFFLIYRCILGFAVLNVVNAVFVQQTMKTASSDEELAFKQKEKDIAAYARKVKKLFQSMDASGDGSISLDEFSKLVTSPKLKFWMSQLELEYHDLMSLFEFLDNGDGEITLSEFIEGAARLRGSAKALDIWRIETKVEVLFEEVLNVLYRVASPDTVTEIKVNAIQDVFDNSVFRHIKSNARGRVLSPMPEEDEGEEEDGFGKVVSSHSPQL